MHGGLGLERGRKDVYGARLARGLLGFRVSQHYFWLNNA